MPLLPTRNSHGGLAAFCLVIYKMVKRCIVLDVTYLMLLDVVELRKVGNTTADFRPLGYTEVIEDAQDPATDLDAKMARRLQGDLDICFGAFVENQLAGYIWLAFDSIEAVHNRGDSEETGVAMSFPEDAVFLYKAFVQSKFRGQGIYKDLVRAAGCWIHDRCGIRSIISTTEWTNDAALRSCRRQGFRPLGRVWRFGLPGWMWTVGPRGAARHGISFGEACHNTRRPIAASSR